MRTFDRLLSVKAGVFLVRGRKVVLFRGENIEKNVLIST